MTRIGVALSGGGHRATIWGLGVLLYLADAGRQGDVGAIASVVARLRAGRSNLHVLLDDYPLPAPRPAQDGFRSLIGDR